MNVASVFRFRPIDFDPLDNRGFHKPPKRDWLDIVAPVVLWGMLLVAIWFVVLWVAVLAKWI